MKIEGESPNTDAAAGSQRSEQAKRLEQNRFGGPRPAERSDGSADRVDLSEDARFVKTAVNAANEAPDIRRSLVDQARQKLAAGELGRDLLGLADRLIDHLLRR